MKLLIRYGLIHGGIESFGGLFTRDPDDGSQCTLDTILNEGSESQIDAVWSMIDDLIEFNKNNVEALFIVHAAVVNSSHISNNLFRTIVKKYGVSTRNNDGDLPLHHAVKKGMKWDGRIEVIAESYSNAIEMTDNATGLPLLHVAASLVDPDLTTIYKLLRRDVQYIMNEIVVS